MTEFELVPYSNASIESIGETEKNEIDHRIDGLIQRYRQDSQQIALMAIEATSLATAVESRASGVAGQGFFSRLLNTVTGINQRISALNQADTARAQYISQEVISRLFQQGAMTFEAVVIVDQKVNWLAKNATRTEERLNEVLDIMGKFYQKQRQILAAQEEFQRNDDLIFWKDTLKYEELPGGKTIMELSAEEKLLRIAADFFRVSGARWNARDILFLKAVMDHVELPPNSEVSLSEVLGLLGGEPALLEYLLGRGRFEIARAEDQIETPFLATVRKFGLLAGDESYLPETVRELLPEASPDEIRLRMALNYGRKFNECLFADSVAAFDAVWQIVGELFMLKGWMEGESRVAVEEIEAPSTRSFQSHEVRLGQLLCFMETVPRPRELITGPLPNMRFAHIPPGEFWMGSPEDEPGRYGDEKRHRVRLRREFWMQTTPVTQGQWEAVTGENPSYFKEAGPDAPVENVSWDDVCEFIRKLNEMAVDLLFRLPTEAEWEYACRAGTETAFYNGPIDPREGRDFNLEQVGWYNEKGGCPNNQLGPHHLYHKIYWSMYVGRWWSGMQSHPVGEKEPNAWGLYDMHGNVWEWCADCYNEYPDGPATDPMGSGTINRVFRGGSWRDPSRWCRAAFRTSNTPDTRCNILGFRLVAER